MKQALLDAFSADPGSRSRRMRAMRRTVMRHDVARWAADFLEQLSRTRA
jgi:trehalose 6-phosphate synthase